MDDLPQRLRSVSNTQAPYANDLVLGWCHQAAHEITRLQGEVGRLREALGQIADYRPATTDKWIGDLDPYMDIASATKKIARTALKEIDHG